ncbi:MAG: hypothetical protein F4118_00300 [Acidimicrobiaceae bacterium]|nr:hypothetical protein [Candidatus Poribacteria bacterium]MYI34862.1 hypothetical protein [Acidimicrobiaceae bacterium]
MKTLTYRRNWMYEQHADVQFVDGSSETLPCTTNGKGQIDSIHYDGTDYTAEQLGALGISYVHFVTPARLEIRVPTEVLIETYERLGKDVSKSSNISKIVATRNDIIDELRRRHVNIHEVLSIGVEIPPIKFEIDESVVAADAYGTHSGKVVEILDDDYYRVQLCVPPGATSIYRWDKLRSFNGNKFMV